MEDRFDLGDVESRLAVQQMSMEEVVDLKTDYDLKRAKIRMQRDRT